MPRQVSTLVVWVRWFVFISSESLISGIGLMSCSFGVCRRGFDPSGMGDLRRDAIVDSAFVTVDLL